MPAKLFFQITGVLLLGVIGALLFQVFIFPWMLSDPYFEKFDFVKSFKEGKIVISPKEQVYIQENTALQGAIEKIEKTVVAIQASTSAGTLLGSGFVLASDGTILTVSDLAPSSAKITVFAEGEKFTGQVVKRDKKNNLTLLKIGKTGLATAGFAEADKIKLGQRVFIFGISATTKEKTTNEGIIKAISENAVKTSIVDSLHFRGGPLFDIVGNVVGICLVDSGGKISSIPLPKIKTFSGL